MVGQGSADISSLATVFRFYHRLRNPNKEVHLGKETRLLQQERLNNRAVRGGVLPGGHQVVPVDGLQVASHGVRDGRREPSF